MAFYLAECWRGNSPTGKILEYFKNCLKKPVLFLCFPKLLQAFRKLNMFNLPDSGMESLIQIIQVCLNSSLKTFNITIPLELINLSSTYYSYKEVPKSPTTRLRSQCDIFSIDQNSKEMNELMRLSLAPNPDVPELYFDLETESLDCGVSNTKKEKFYLLDGIKNHVIFKDIKFWETCLLYQMSENQREFNFHEGSIAESLVTKNYIFKVTNTLMSIAFHMKDVSINANSIMEMISKYAMKYRIPSSNFENLQGFLNQTLSVEASTSLGDLLPSPNDSLRNSVKEKSNFKIRLKRVFGGILKSKPVKEEEELRRRTLAITRMEPMQEEEDDILKSFKVLNTKSMVRPGSN